MRWQRLALGALVGTSRSRGARIHFIRPGSLTSYCSVPVTWATRDPDAPACRNCIREMLKASPSAAP